MNECDQCGGPRSRRSKSLCRPCHVFKQGVNCSHHWVYAAPNGPTSTGVCKLCGKRGKGANSITQEFFPVMGRKAQEENEIKAGRAKYISGESVASRIRNQQGTHR